MCVTARLMLWGRNMASGRWVCVTMRAALQDALLDVRARITNIHDRLGAQASADYERGFTDYIKANDDSLARVLF